MGMTAASSTCAAGQQDWSASGGELGGDVGGGSGRSRGGLAARSRSAHRRCCCVGLSTSSVKPTCSATAPLKTCKQRFMVVRRRHGLASWVCGHCKACREHWECRSSTACPRRATPPPPPPRWRAPANFERGGGRAGGLVGSIAQLWPVPRHNAALNRLLLPQLALPKACRRPRTQNTRGLRTASVAGAVRGCQAGELPTPPQGADRSGCPCSQVCQAQEAAQLHKPRSSAVIQPCPPAHRWMREHAVAGRARLPRGAGSAGCGCACVGGRGHALLRGSPLESSSGTGLRQGYHQGLPPGSYHQGATTRGARLRASHAPAASHPLLPPTPRCPFSKPQMGGRPLLAMVRRPPAAAPAAGLRKSCPVAGHPLRGSWPRTRCALRAARPGLHVRCGHHGDTEEAFTRAV